ncbi:MAG: hypothetical protein K8L97_27755 [Anaerolineae bacterium]|nr:hypothetical protein [Anaerolineae bacterium]
MSLFDPNAFTPHLCFEERANPERGWSALERQPFLHTPQTSLPDRMIVHLTREQGQWSDLMSPEQTAYGLAQVTAAILPPLTHLENGSELLEYHVRLRDYFDDSLVREVMSVLDTEAADLHWGQVETSVYVSVIGSGVAACIDTNHGTLYLRYENTLAAALYDAHRKAELPRSLLFLQSALYERFDALLAQARVRTWFWLAG